ncbi:MAG TPA: ferric reductase-like transmembrane domain-containing protein [Acidimicrobiia bacterium]|nr:ferric reductase-like transmembrane domain-containing protein [Acidimicrobiia bacterium]
MDSRVWWWLTRAAGIVAWVVIAAAVLWGLLASTKMIRRRGVPAWILDLHRYLGTLTIVFIAVHVGAVWLDSFVKFDTKQLFVPFASSWRPHAVAWGIFSTYLLIAIQTTSWAMRKLPRTLWHRVHVLSIPLLVMATVHGYLAGTDRGNRTLQWSAFVIGVGILFLLAARLLTPSRAARSATTPIREPRPARQEVAV